ncbi:MAG: septal ring lytic transglycosylase RlpA family protein, partial [Candidatus Magnetominusculus sp. LBB02]|nr:septal ring lytic transglycosylase RlpA family protein [Candidatus Magnetominusculus sp. LBB02]
VQKVSDNEPPKIPSGATKKYIDDEHTKWAEIARERHIPQWHKSLVKRGVFDEKRYTNCHGNQCETQASMYGKEFDNKDTSSGTKHRAFGYTAAMPPLYVGELDPKKPIYVEVTNNDTHPPRSVIVKVEDKGPFPIRDKELRPKEGIYPPKGVKAHHEDPTRGIDLSPAAYAKIVKNPGDGVFNVTVKFLSDKDGEKKYSDQQKWAAEHRSEIEKSVKAARKALKGKSK